MRLFPLHLPQWHCSFSPPDTLQATRQAPARVGSPRSRASTLLGALAFALILTAGIRLAPQHLVTPLANTLPASWIRASSEQVLSKLEAEDLSASLLPEAQQHALQDRFASLLAAPEGAPPYRLLFRHSRSGQYSLLTLPGGEIIVTDQLLETVPDQREQLALLCHALGHLFHRHDLRNAVDAGFFRIAAAVLTGSSARSIKALDQGLQKGHFTLEAVLEADRYALSMLQANQLPPSLLVTAIEHAQSPAADPTRTADPLAHREHFTERLRALQKML